MLLGTALRVGLFWINPPGNSFDNHFEPIRIIMDTGHTPPKLACWECYQPPIFYVTSAITGDFLLGSGIASNNDLAKYLQFLNCLYGIATLWVVLLILRLLPLSDFAKLLSFGILCFLPRHIYMSALHSNDTLAYLAVSVCIYFLILIAEKQHTSIALLLLMSVVVSITIFVKYTALIIIPAIALAFLLLPWRHSLSFRFAATKGIVVLMLPLVLLGAYIASNVHTYGTALPFNTVIYNPTEHQPHDEKKYDFLSFKPWLFIEYPILRPGQLNSFWTILHAGMWFDIEPKFLRFTGNDQWWDLYYGWLNGGNNFPDDTAGGPRHSILYVGSSLEALGIMPQILGVSGLVFLIKDLLPGSTRRRECLVLSLIFLGLWIFAAGQAALLAMNVPVFSSMKSSYVLTALPAFCAFAGFGVQALEKRRWSRIACGALLGVFFLLVIVHVLQIAYYWPSLV